MKYSTERVGERKNGWVMIEVAGDAHLSATGARKLIIHREGQNHIRYMVTREQWLGAMERIAIAVAHTKVEGALVRSEGKPDIRFGRGYLAEQMLTVPADYWKDPFLEVLVRRDKILYLQGVHEEFRWAMRYGGKYSYIMNNWPALIYTHPMGTAARGVEEKINRKKREFKRAIDNAMRVGEELAALSGVPLDTLWPGALPTPAPVPDAPPEQPAAPLPEPPEPVEVAPAEPPERTDAPPLPDLSQTPEMLALATDFSFMGDGEDKF